MLNFLNLEQGSKEWLEYRRTKIGASEAAAILGIDPWTTPLMLFDAKLTGTQKQENEDMRRGKTLEASVRRMTNERHLRNFQPVVVANPKYDFGFASLDGWDESADIPIIEIKCPRRNVPALPEHYMAQLQWQMMITEKHEALYISYDGAELIEIPVKADPSWAEKLESSGRAFFDHLVNFDPPPCTKKDYQVIDDPRAKEEAKKYKAICSQIDELSEQKDIQRKILISLADGKNSIIDNLHILKTGGSRIDYASLIKKYEIDPEPFRKPNKPSWRIS